MKSYQFYPLLLLRSPVYPFDLSDNRRPVKSSANVFDINGRGMTNKMEIYYWYQKK